MTPPLVPSGPAVVKARKPGRAVRLEASAPSVWPGGRILLRARTVADATRAAASQAPVLKIRRRGLWLRVATLRPRGKSYAAGVWLGKLGHKTSRRFGSARVPRATRTLGLRVYVRGVGHSNIVQVRIRR